MALPEKRLRRDTLNLAIWVNERNRWFRQLTSGTPGRRIGEVGGSFMRSRAIRALSLGVGFLAAGYCFLGSPSDCELGRASKTASIYDLQSGRRCHSWCFVVPDRLVHSQSF
jgi:hypothetical protein